MYKSINSYTKLGIIEEEVKIDLHFTIIILFSYCMCCLYNNNADNYTEVRLNHLMSRFKRLLL